MRVGNLMIVQGGGPTAVFNISLASVISEGMRQDGIRKIFGARSGVKGLAQGDVIDLSRLTAEDIGMLRNRPGAALGSSTSTALLLRRITSRRSTSGMGYHPEIFQRPRYCSAGCRREYFDLSVNRTTQFPAITTTAHDSPNGQRTFKEHVASP